MRWLGILVTVGVLAAWPVRAVTVERSLLTGTPNEHACESPRAQTRFGASERQAFIWFLVRRASPEDRLRVEWVDPEGKVAITAAYGELPRAPSLCLMTALPIAGFAPASQPGSWRVRVYARDRRLFDLPFEIRGEQGSARLGVTGVSRSQATGGVELALTGYGFVEGMLVYLATYEPAKGWQYVANSKPQVNSATLMNVRFAALRAAEYQIVLRAPDGEVSRPYPFTVSAGGYRLPTAAGQAWELTQGNVGSFSHYGRTMYAYDLAPRGFRCVVAMKRGVAYTHDAGIGQTLARSFGNYITIDHGDGEYSHYAHLATGTFLVANGQTVEQGQPLATVGNSGYTVGEGGGYHVHVQVTRAFPIASQSVPFHFEDLPHPRRGTVVSKNGSPECDCRVSGQQWASAGISGGQWWHQGWRVPARAGELSVRLAWQGPADLTLHLVSPSGRHYGWYGDTTGYSGGNGAPEQFQVRQPEAGVWRLSVNARAAPQGAVPFRVEAWNR